MALFDEIESQHADSEILPEIKNPLDQLFGYRMRRISANDMACLLEKLLPFQLTNITASVLLVILENENITQSDVGRCLGIQRANMAPLTNLLESKGLIDKIAIDGRSFGLHVTEQGRALCDEIMHLMRETDTAILSQLSATEQAILNLLLDKMLT